MNSERLGQRLDMLASAAIIVVALLVGAVTVRNVFFRAKAPNPNIPAGTRMALPDVDWAKHDRTLLLVLQKGCSYCNDSAPFYQKLAKEARENDRLGLVAVLPQGVDEGRSYLRGLGVELAEVKQSTLRSIGVRATPTVALIDRHGVVVRSWLGKLSAQKEVEVLAALRSTPKAVADRRQIHLPR